VAGRQAQPVSGAGPRLVAAWLLLLLASACVPANPDNDTYEGKVAVTLGGALSEVATVEKILETMHEGRMLRPTAVAQLRYSQDSLDTNTGAFNQVNPPADLDWLYARTNDLLSAAGDVTNEARLAIARRQDNRYVLIADALKALADKLDKLQTRVS
jgi:hypothetical protein